MENKCLSCRAGNGFLVSCFYLQEFTRDGCGFAFANGSFQARNVKLNFFFFIKSIGNNDFLKSGRLKKRHLNVLRLEISGNF